MAQKFMIGPIKGGLQTDVRPWLITDDAFESMQNAYIFYGRVRKRFGSEFLNTAVPGEVQQLYSRLGINVGVTSGGGAAAGFAPGARFGIGQMFAIGDEIFTVNQLGAPAPLLSTGAGVGTFDTGTGAFTFAGAAGAAIVYFYPGEPVMGFTNYENVQLNFEPTVAFDRQFAYQYSAVTNRWERLATGTDTWTGSDSDFFWSVNYQGLFANVRILYTTNNVIADGIRYWDGATWARLRPIYNTAGDTIEAALIVVPFKNRLLFMNLTERVLVGPVTTTYVNRLRYSQNGSPLEVDSWQQRAKKGNFLDLPVQQAIINCSFLRDRLIVYAERSTWELVYIGNEVAPFRWQQLNSELGSESTFSVVPFDKLVLAIGNVGIHGCNGATVERIDEKVREIVFQIKNETEGIKRVAGIRDYYVQAVYWAYTDSGGEVFPNRILHYNYINNTWAQHEDCITAFGYFQPFFYQTWENTFSRWEDMLQAWNAGQDQARFRKVIAGNQEGYTFTIEPDIPLNEAVLQITNINQGAPFDPQHPGITIINHNLDEDSFIQFLYLPDFPDMDNQIFQIIRVFDGNTIVIERDINTILPYNGGALVSRVSRINILSKQYNFFQSQGKNMVISTVDFSVDKTTNGEISVVFYSSTSSQPITLDGQANDALLGNSTLDTRPYPAALAPLEQSQEQVWHSLSPQMGGEYIQVSFFWTNDQMVDPTISLEDFQLHAMVFHVRQTGQLRS